MTRRASPCLAKRPSTGRTRERELFLADAHLGTMSSERVSRKTLLGSLASLGIIASTDAAGIAAPNAVIGAWSLVSFNERVKGGSFEPRFGPNPVGYLIYTASGRVSATLQGAHRLPFTSPDGTSPSEHDRTESVHNFLAYGGRYEIRGSEVFHHIETSIFTNLVGITLKRGFTLHGDTLTIRTLPPYIWGNESVLVWHRT